MAGEGKTQTLNIKIGDEEVTVNAVFSLPVGAVPVFLGLLLVIAVLIEPYLIQQGLLMRTPRGRVALPAAWHHVGLAPPPAAGPDGTTPSLFGA